MSPFSVLGALCSLTVEKTMPEDGGEYKCVAENTVGKAESACRVVVEGECFNGYRKNSP